MTTALQLDLWRAACRHVDLAEGIADLAAALRRAVPVTDMRIFSIESGRCVLAATDPAVPHPASLSPVDTEPLTRFAEAGSLRLIEPDPEVAGPLAPLLGLLGPGRHLCGGLRQDGQPEGVVAWTIRDPAWLPNDVSLAPFAAALEPIRATLETSRRFHELEALRRSAEADRAGAALDFITALFDGADPEVAGGDTMHVFQLLDRGEDLVAAIRANPEEYLFDYFMRTDNGVRSTAFPFDRETDYDPDGRELWSVGLRFRVNVASSSSESGLFNAMLRHYESGAKEVGSDQFVHIELPPFFPVAVRTG